MPPAASIVLDPVDPAAVRALRAELRCSETMAWVLARRGVRTAAEAHRLLDRPEDDPASFHDPFLLGDMVAAVERIRFAVEQGELITVHGDYDADGVCSTTVLAEALEAIGARVEVFLPDRFSNGYGLQLETVEQLAGRGTRLLLTVDCGITAVEPIAQAADHGIDTIVLDHHEPGAELPAAIICSTRPSEYPFPHLCATAVAGKLVQALGAPYDDRVYELEAIATIADCMPLVEENRAIVRRGLRALRRTNRPGLRALLSCCQVHARDADEDTVGFKLAPRINAVGRIANPMRAYELLRAPDKATGTAAAMVLHEANEQRRRIEQRIVAEATDQVERWTDEQRAARCYVVSGVDWHEGVVGIVASRLVEKYSRPVVVVAENEPLARGSARSIDAFDLHGALAQCDDILVRWGGHRAAGGVTVEPRRIGELRARLAQIAARELSETDLAPTLRADAVVSGDDLGHGLVEELAKLAPFGTGNPRPVLLATAVTAADVRAMGDGTHVRFRATLDDATIPVVAFRQGHLAPELQAGASFDLGAHLVVNRFRGAESIELAVEWMQQVAAPVTAGTGDCVAGACNLTCSERRPLGEVLAAATAPHPAAAGGTDGPPMLPAPEPLLAAAGTADLRHTGAAVSQVARLLTAGSSVLVFTADVARRRTLVAGRLRPARIGATGVLVSARCDLDAARARIARARSAGRPLLLLADEDVLPALATELAATVDQVVVLDPPATVAGRDALLALGRPLHLAWGAAEVRFTRDAAGAVANVRATLGAAWKPLRAGGLDAAALEATLFAGTDAGAELLHAPAAVAHALHELTRKGLVAVDASALTVTALDPAPATA